MTTPQLINPKKTSTVLSASPEFRKSRNSIDPTLLEMQNRIFEVEEFLPKLGDYKKKLEEKKSVATSVIQEKMKELHALINKWEARFVDTARETLDDKIEALNQQEEKLKDVLKDMQDILHQNRDKVSTIRRDLLNNNEEDVSLDDSQTDEEAFSADEELKKQLEKVYAVKFPLKPEGVKQEEFNFENLKDEFKGLLDEARKSLKRSLAFAGGIVRGYLRRGQKNEKWVPMLRRLEARTEVNEEMAAQVSSMPSVQMTKSISAKSSALPFFQLKSRAEQQNRVWKAVGDLFKYRNNLSLRSELSKNLAQLHVQYAAEIEFYLPQLVNIMLNKKDFQPLEQFVMDHCRDSIHFALQVYLLIRSMGDTGPEKWRKRCRKMLKKVETAILTEEEMKERVRQTKTPSESPVKLTYGHSGHPSIDVQPSPTKLSSSGKTTSKPSNGNGGSKSSNNNLPVKPLQTSSGYVSSPGTSPDEAMHSPPRDPPHITVLGQKTPGTSSKSLRMKGKEYFFETVRFLDEIVDISRALTAKYGMKEEYSKSYEFETKQDCRDKTCNFHEIILTFSSARTQEVVDEHSKLYQRRVCLY
jgi:chaperonin cofactor prefoldin